MIRFFFIIFFMECDAWIYLESFLGIDLGCLCAGLVVILMFLKSALA